MMVHACNHRTQEAEAKRPQFKANLGYCETLSQPHNKTKTKKAKRAGNVT
jgi:hypothetical protein